MNQCINLGNDVFVAQGHTLAHHLNLDTTWGHLFEKETSQYQHPLLQGRSGSCQINIAPCFCCVTLFLQAGLRFHDWWRMNFPLITDSCVLDARPDGRPTRTLPRQNGKNEGHDSRLYNKSQLPTSESLHLYGNVINLFLAHFPGWLRPECCCRYLGESLGIPGSKLI